MTKILVIYKESKDVISELELHSVTEFLSLSYDITLNIDNNSYNQSSFHSFKCSYEISGSIDVCIEDMFELDCSYIVDTLYDEMNNVTSSSLMMESETAAVAIAEEFYSFLIVNISTSDINSNKFSHNQASVDEEWITSLIKVIKLKFQSDISTRYTSFSDDGSCEFYAASSNLGKLSETAKK